MKKAILPIIIGYSAMIMLSGCKTSNDELNSSNVINSDILSESSSSQSSETTSTSNKDNEINSSSIEGGSEEKSSSADSTPDINQSDISNESNSSQSNVAISSSESRDEDNSNSMPNINNSNTTSESNHSQIEAPNSTSSESNGTNSMPSGNNSTPGNNVSELGTVEIIDGLLELKRDGQARGEIEAGMKIDCGKATLTKGSNVTFNVDCKQKLANIKITLTDGKTGKHFEGDVVGRGKISLDIETAGEYVVTIENCYDKATYFTIEYHISDKANTI